MAIIETHLEDRINLAILYFKSSSFEKALRIYNELIKELSEIPPSQIKQIRSKKYNLGEIPIIGPTVHPKLGSILDQRAATYEKLGDITMALKDGEKLMKMEPISCKGYLRVGKILIKNNREVEAYKIYQEGLYTIKSAIDKYKINVPEMLFQKLKSQYSLLNTKLKSKQNKTISQQTPSFLTNEANSKGLKSRLNTILPLKRLQSSSNNLTSKKLSSNRAKDPFSILTLEIIDLIFQKLPLNDLLKCHLISKNWYYTLTSIPTLYNTRIHFKMGITYNEFSNGLHSIKRIIKCSNSKEIKQLKIRSTSNSMQLTRIIQTLINEKNLKMQKLDIINKSLSMELLSHLLNKNNWNFSNLSQITQLRLGLNSSVKFENLIFKIMKNLKLLDVMIIDKQFSSSNKHLIAKNDSMSKFAEDITAPFHPLETLSIVNHPTLKKNNIPININEDTFNPYPPFLDKTFPNLIKLTIVSYDFSGRYSKLGAFFKNSPNLKSIYLENNDNLTMLNFCEILREFQPNFILDYLALRETKATKEIHLNQFHESDLVQLNNLNVLDVYFSSFSIKGLLKFLKICNMNNNLNTLLLGSSNYIYFKNDKISSRVAKLSLCEILLIVPRLSKLYLNELELDNSSMKFFYNDISNIVGVQNCKLSLLDLSFCNQIDGIGLMNLFNVYSRSASPDTSAIFKLDSLIIDGMNINQDTLKILKKKGFVASIRNDTLRTKWRKYGHNSLVPEV